MPEAPAPASAPVSGIELAAGALEAGALEEGALAAGALEAGVLADGAAVAAAAVTVIDPIMLGWISQKYSYVPTVSNVNENVSPVARLPESNDAGPLVEVAVWEKLSRLVQVTVSPTSMVRSSGLNRKS